MPEIKNKNPHTKTLFWWWPISLLARCCILTPAAASLSGIYEQGWGCVKEEKSQKSCYLQLCTEMIFTFQLLVKQIKLKGGHFSPRIQMIKWNQPLLWNKCWSSRSREGVLSASANRAEVKELCCGWSHLAGLESPQGSPARTPSSLSLLSCTNPQGGRARRNTSAEDMELDWETERHPTGFIVRAVFNLKKTPCKCRDPSKEPPW